MYNKNNFTGVVSVVKPIQTPKEGFGYAFVVNDGKEKDNSLFIKILLRGAMLDYAPQFFQNGRKLFVSGILENSVYQEKSQLVLNMTGFAPVDERGSSGESENGESSGERRKTSYTKKSPDKVPF